MKVISSMATRRLLEELARAATDDGQPEFAVESVGGVDAFGRVAAGEPFDLVILAESAVRELSNLGHVRGATVTPLVRSQVAVAVASGDGCPAVARNESAFADAHELQDALRAAGRVGYSTGPSGTALVRMIDDWGLTGELRDRLVQARPGIPVARSVADGDVDLGFQQLSELVGHVGVRILGVLPADCAIDTVFAGAVAATSTAPVEATAALAFLASAVTVDIRERNAFGVPEHRHAQHQPASPERP